MLYEKLSTLPSLIYNQYPMLIWIGLASLVGHRGASMRDRTTSPGHWVFTNGERRKVSRGLDLLNESLAKNMTIDPKISRIGGSIKTFRVTMNPRRTIPFPAERSGA